MMEAESDWTDAAASPGTFRIAGHHQKLERGKHGPYLESQGSMTLPTAWFQTSSLQNWIAINFWGFFVSQFVDFLIWQSS